jgi:hypothetical protein
MQEQLRFLHEYVPQYPAMLDKCNYLSFYPHVTCDWFSRFPEEVVYWGPNWKAIMMQQRDGVDSDLSIIPLNSLEDLMHGEQGQLNDTI